MTYLQVSKGHGTGNDFVLFTAGAVDLSEELVRALANRRCGIGADGVIQAVPAGQLGIDGAHWFMDYRNADGSIAQMCGNGVRVFAEYLRRWGHIDDAALAAGVPIATRAGIRTVRTSELGYTVDMGPVRVEPGWISVLIPPGAQAVAGLRVDVGNPHTVVQVASRAALARADLRQAPAIDPPPGAGTNVELAVVDAARQEIHMRVFERGVGETSSCGTGVVAAAAAAATWTASSEGTWLVHVPGGTLRVQLADGQASLEGPAVMVASANVDLAALELAKPDAAPAAPGTP